MFLNVDNRTDVEIIWADMFNEYISDILVLQRKLETQEDVYGRSCIQYQIARYYYAFTYVLMIYIDYKRGFFDDWADVIVKYDMETMDKKFNCNDIVLDTLLGIAGLPEYTSSTSYVNPPSKQIGSTLVVGGNTPFPALTMTTYELLNLINADESCTTIL